MTLLNYTTTISVAKSAGEIQGKLVAHDANSIRQDFKGGRLTAISFQLDTPAGPAAFRLPANSEAVYLVLCRQLPAWKAAEGCKGYSQSAAKSVKAHREQAERVAWRILKDWIEAQMAIRESEMVSMEEIFLPYLIVRDGKTLYAHMAETQFQLKSGE